MPVTRLFSARAAALLCAVFVTTTSETSETAWQQEQQPQQPKPDPVVVPGEKQAPPADMPPAPPAPSAPSPIKAG